MTPTRNSSLNEEDASHHSGIDSERRSNSYLQRTTTQLYADLGPAPSSPQGSDAGERYNADVFDVDGDRRTSKDGGKKVSSPKKGAGTNGDAGSPGGGGGLSLGDLEGLDKAQQDAKEKLASPRSMVRRRPSAVQVLPTKENNIADDFPDDGSQASSSQSSSISALNDLMKANAERMGLEDGMNMPRFMIHPNSQRYRQWYWVTIVFVIYSAIATPLVFAFLQEQSPADNPEGEKVTPTGAKELEYIDFAVDTIFFIDILITFLVAYLDDDTGALVIDRRKVALTYLFSWKFVMDCAATFPFDRIAETIAGKPVAIVSYLGLLRLIRLNRLAKVFVEAEENVRFDYTRTRLLKFMTIVLLVGHWAGCLMYFLAFTKDFDDDTWVGSSGEELNAKYVTSMYWAITTLSTVGYGDLSPVSSLERIMAVIYMIVNFGLSSYLLGNMTMLLTRADQSTGDYRMQVAVLEKFMARNSLPEELVLQMRSYLQLQFEAREDNEAILLEFPHSVRTRVLRFLYRSVLENVYFVEGCEANFIDTLLTSMTTELFMPNSWIIQQWDVANEMYIVARGKIDVFIQGEEGKQERIMKLGVADPVGEAAFVCNLEHTLSYRCHGMTRLLILHRDAFKDITMQFPKDVSNLLKKVLERAQLTERNFARNLTEKREAGKKVSKAREVALEVMGDMVGNVQRQMDQNKQDAVGAFCHAASIGNIPDMRRLIAGGLEPSTVDYDSRSALHVAAGKDQVNAVRYLLDHGADPNIIDHFGRSPLLEAIQAGNDSAAEMLKRAGGQLGLKMNDTSQPSAVAAAVVAAPRVSSAEEGHSEEPRISAGGELCDAASSGEMDYLKRLIRFGLDPSEGDYDNRTALHLASVKGQMQIVRTLLEYGANPSAFDNFGRTPLVEAVRHGNDGAARLIFAAGGRLGLKTLVVDGEATVGSAGAAVGGVAGSGHKVVGEPGEARELAGEMCTAVFEDDLEYLNRLLKFGGNPNAGDYDMRTALHVTACEGKLHAAVILLDNHAKPDIMDRWGRSPLDDAISNNHPELQAVLEKYIRDNNERAAADATKGLGE